MHHVTSDYCSAIQAVQGHQLGWAGWAYLGRWATALGAPACRPALACKLFQRRHQLTPPTQQPYHHPAFFLMALLCDIIHRIVEFQGNVKKSQKPLEVAKDLGIRRD